MGRRALLGKVAAGSAALALPLSPALANTAAELAEPMAQFNDGEAKRAAFMVKMKAYKKSWRKELANLEYSTSDAEAKEAVVALIKASGPRHCAPFAWRVRSTRLPGSSPGAQLIRVNGNEIPEGVRKQDLDQARRDRPPQRRLVARSPLGGGAAAVPRAAGWAAGAAVQPRAAPAAACCCTLGCDGRAVEHAHAADSSPLTQVYKRVKDNLGKDTRMAYLQLDTIVRDIVTVKSLKGFGEELPIP